MTRDAVTLAARRSSEVVVMMNTIVLWLLLSCLLAGCSAQLEPGRLPSPEELCAIQGGRLSAGVCHTSGGM